MILEIRLTDNARDFISFGPHFDNSLVIMTFNVNELAATFFDDAENHPLKAVIMKLNELIETVTHDRPKLRLEFIKIMLQDEDCSLSNIESLINSSADMSTSISGTRLHFSL